MLRATEVPSKNRQQDSPSFVTDFLPLASFLKACGHSYELQLTSPGTILFAFAPSSSLNGDVAAFNERKALVEPAVYDAARLALRKQMQVLKAGAR